MKRVSLACGVFLLGALAGSYVLVPLFVHSQQAPNPAPVVFPKEMSSYREVVKRVLPAVVSIEMKVKPKAKGEVKRRRPPDDSQIPEEFRKFFEEFRGRQFEMPDESDTPSQGFGSGFIVDPKGVIMTNNHVVAGADQVDVTLNDGRKFVSKEIKTDRKTDLAIVKIESKEPLPYLDLGDSDAMEIGDRVLAAGAPFGLTGSVTSGIVSAKGRNGLSMNMYEDFLQTDAAINPGNSGGPLLNLEGKVIGINSAIKSRSGGFQGVGLAVASNLAKDILQKLKTDGQVRRGYLGVSIRDLDADVATRLGVKEKKGVLIAQVMDGAPAAKAGFQSGDVVTAIDGKPVKDGRDLQRVVKDLPLKKPVDVSVYRDGKMQTLSVTVEQQPDEFGSGRGIVPSRAPNREQEPNSLNVDKIGVEISDLSAEQAEKLGFKGTPAGVLVTKVDPDGLAGQGGLRPKMLIIKVDNKPVKSAEAAKSLLAKADLDQGVLLQIQTAEGITSYLVLKAEGAVK